VVLHLTVDEEVRVAKYDLIHLTRLMSEVILFLNVSYFQVMWRTART